MKVFVDSSVLFKWMMWFIKYKELTFLERLFEKFSSYEFVVSTYVLEEILMHHEKFKLSKYDLENYLITFIEKFRIRVFVSKKFDEGYVIYVEDEFDTPVLYDAISSNCQILLTSNLKDFKINKIKKEFWLLVVDKI